VYMNTIARAQRAFELLAHVDAFRAVKLLERFAAKEQIPGLVRCV